MFISSSAMRRPSAAAPPSSSNPKTNLIMSRYRPIAPKPLLPAAASDSSHDALQCVPDASLSARSRAATPTSRKRRKNPTPGEMSACAKRPAAAPPMPPSNAPPRKAPLWFTGGVNTQNKTASGGLLNNVSNSSALGDDDDDVGFMERAAAASAAPSHVFPFSYMSRSTRELSTSSTSATTGHGYGGGSGCFAGMIRGIAGRLPTTTTTSVLLHKQQAQRLPPLANINLLPALSSDSATSTSSSVPLVIPAVPPLLSAAGDACRGQQRSRGAAQPALSDCGNMSTASGTPSEAPDLPTDKWDYYKRVCASEQEQEQSGLDEEAAAGDTACGRRHVVAVDGGDDDEKSPPSPQCRPLVTLNLLPETPSRYINHEGENSVVFVSPLSMNNTRSRSVEEHKVDRDSDAVDNSESSGRGERIRRRLFEFGEQQHQQASKTRCSWSSRRNTNVSYIYGDISMVEQMYGGASEAVALLEDGSKTLLWANDSYRRNSTAASLLTMASPFIDPLGVPVPILTGHFCRHPVTTAGCSASAAVPSSTSHIYTSATLWGFLRKLVVQEEATHAERIASPVAAEVLTSSSSSSIGEVSLMRRSVDSASVRRSPTTYGWCCCSSCGGGVIMPRPVRLVGSKVSLESVINVEDDDDAYGEEAAAAQDMEAVKGGLEEEGSPAALMTDESGGVVWWVNASYKRMVGQPDCPWLTSTVARGSPAAASIAGEVTISGGGAGLPRRFRGRASIEWCRMGLRNCISLPCSVCRVWGGRRAALLWEFDMRASLNLTCGVGSF